MNLVILSGIVDGKYPPSQIPGTDGIRVRIASYFTSQGEKKVNYFSFVVWDKNLTVEDLVPGTAVAVHGFLRTRSYDKDGTKVWVTEVHAQQGGCEVLLKGPSKPVGTLSADATPEEDIPF